jgi:hypothetical protein
MNDLQYLVPLAAMRISLEDIFLPYPLNLSAEIIQTYPVLAEIQPRALRSASSHTTGPESPLVSSDRCTRL